MNKNAVNLRPANNAKLEEKIEKWAEKSNPPRQSQTGLKRLRADFMELRNHREKVILVSLKKVITLIRQKYIERACRTKRSMASHIL